MDSLFKSWVPDWMIKIILFGGMMPSMVLFFLPVANMEVTAGYYGCQISDVQFLIVLFYSGFVSFYVLERKFFDFFPTKTYYIIFSLLQISNCILMVHIKDVEWVYGLRFIQGMLFASAVNLCISNIFVRLKSLRAKEGSYVIFFGMLLCSSPFNTIVTADIIDSNNYDELYRYSAWIFCIVLALFMLMMKYSINRRSYNLWSLDYASFILYSSLIICIGYLMIYGQELYWFYSIKILRVFALLIFTVVVFIIRQLYLRKKYIHMGIFSNRNFLLGCIVLFVMYVERFSLAISNQYFKQALHFDTIHLSEIQWFNIVGIVSGVTISYYLMLKSKSVKWIWCSGFLILLIYHQIMLHSFERDGNEEFFYVPLVLHGLGIGLIMVPTILFVVASVKKEFGISAAAFCLAVRYFGYTCNIGVLNYAKLFWITSHTDTFSSQILSSNPILHNYLDSEIIDLTKNGLTAHENKAGIKLLIEEMHNQSITRFAIDYYEVMSFISIILIMIIILFPSLKNIFQKLKINLISPV